MSTVEKPVEIPETRPPKQQLEQRPGRTFSAQHQWPPALCTERKGGHRHVRNQHIRFEEDARERGNGPDKRELKTALDPTKSDQHALLHS